MGINLGAERTAKGDLMYRSNRIFAGLMQQRDLHQESRQECVVRWEDETIFRAETIKPLDTNRK